MNEQTGNICYGRQDVASELRFSNLIDFGIVTGKSIRTPPQPVEGHSARTGLLCSVPVTWAVWGLPMASRPRMIQEAPPKLIRESKWATTLWTIGRVGRSWYEA